MKSKERKNQLSENINCEENIQSTSSEIVYDAPKSSICKENFEVESNQFNSLEAVYSVPTNNLRHEEKEAGQEQFRKNTTINQENNNTKLNLSEEVYNVPSSTPCNLVLGQTYPTRSGTEVGSYEEISFWKTGECIDLKDDANETTSSRNNNDHATSSVTPNSEAAEDEIFLIIDGQTDARDVSSFDDSDQNPGTSVSFCNDFLLDTGDSEDDVSSFLDSKLSIADHSYLEKNENHKKKTQERQKELRNDCHSKTVRISSARTSTKPYDFATIEPDGKKTRVQITTEIKPFSDSAFGRSSYFDKENSKEPNPFDVTDPCDIAEHSKRKRIPPCSKVNFVKKAFRRKHAKRGIKSSLQKLLGRKRKKSSCSTKEVFAHIEFEEYENIQAKEQLLQNVITDGTPFSLWNKPTLIAWLELWVNLPRWFVSSCQEVAESGEMILKLTDEDLRKELKINHLLHRLKLRLAIREIASLTLTQSLKTSLDTCLASGHMNHTWVADDWLPSLGLGQYRSYFLDCLIDGRMLEHLTRKHAKQFFKMTDDFHWSSLSFGIQCLKRLDFNRKELERRRKESYDETKDLLVWSNQRVIKWLEGIGLQQYAGILSGNGVHGAMLVLDHNLDANTLAQSMEIPPKNTEARELLRCELSKVKVSTKYKMRSTSKIPPKISDKWEFYDRPLPSLPAAGSTHYEVIWSGSDKFEFLNA